MTFDCNLLISMTNTGEGEDNKLNVQLNFSEEILFKSKFKNVYWRKNHLAFVNIYYQYNTYLYSKAMKLFVTYYWKLI